LTTYCSTVDDTGGDIGAHFARWDASGLSSVVFGMFLIYQIAFVDGLFTSYAHWTPR
jgi:hypothetical protein